jgi:hypothetical protein
MTRTWFALHVIRRTACTLPQRAAAIRSPAPLPGRTRATFSSPLPTIREQTLPTEPRRPRPLSSVVSATLQVRAVRTKAAMSWGLRPLSNKLFRGGGVPPLLYAGSFHSFERIYEIPVVHDSRGVVLRVHGFRTDTVSFVAHFSR